MNWKKLVETKNAKTYVLPDGWDSREVVAKQLDCTEDMVDKNLYAALKSGEVEKKQWPVWNSALSKKVLVIAYREADKVKPAATPEFDLARAKALKEAGKSYAEIGAVMGMSGDTVRGKFRRAG